MKREPRWKQNKHEKNCKQMKTKQWNINTNEKWKDETLNENKHTTPK